MSTGSTLIPSVTLDLDAILMKADKSPYAQTYQSDLSGVAYAVSKDGGILIVDKHGFFGKSIDDWRVIHQELGAILEEAERWQKS
jgi:hypothetical protein